MIIPLLEEIVGANHKDEDGNSVSKARNRFNFAFRRFIRVISSFFTPLVILLDDLQWADGSSLELLEVLITDRANPNLMIVAIFRSNEVGETHLLTKAIRDLRAIKTQNDFNLTEITVGDLNISSVDRLLKDLLLTEDERTHRLAEICHKKTNGNVFFLLHFLSMHYELHLLEYNFGMLKWVYDEAAIEMKTKATANVVDLLKTQMSSLPEDASQILRLAASLGSTFDQYTVTLVLKDFGKVLEGKDSSVVRPALDLLEATGFIEPLGPLGTLGHSKCYRWVHDKIQEAAATLVPADERVSFNCRVGGVLVNRLSEKELDAAIFSAVDLLNEGDTNHMDEKRRIELAGLNLRAGQKANEVSAFESTAKFVRRGIDLLPANCWNDHYELCLDLFSTGAEAESFLGNVNQVEHYCSEVINQSNRPISDKFRAYNVLLESIANGGRIPEALELCLKVLDICGCKFPKSKVKITFQTIIGIGKMQKKAKSLTTKDLDRMPLMTDPIRKEVCKLCYKLGEYTYLTEHSLLPIVTFRHFSLTMDYGISDYAPTAFASMGIIMTGILNDLQGGAKYGELGLSLLERPECNRSAKPRTMFLIYACMLSWTRPARSVLRPLLEATDIGMQVGDTESAMWAIYQVCHGPSVNLLAASIM
jgi:predicted ATPase